MEARCSVNTVEALTLTLALLGGTKYPHCNCNCNCTDVPVGKEARCSVNTVAAGPAQANMSVVSPSGQPVPSAVEPTPEGFTGKFVPQELGPHTVNVSYADQPIPGSPFRVTATQVSPLQLLHTL